MTAFASMTKGGASEEVDPGFRRDDGGEVEETPPHPVAAHAVPALSREGRGEGRSFAVAAHPTEGRGGSGFFLRRLK
jgi:hypothetical protein